MSGVLHRNVRILVGPTAAGKTSVAHVIARRTGAIVLSADSMLVYRGMDIGTAKPSPAERAGLVYAGIDLAEPSERFDTHDYLERVGDELADVPPDRPILVAGGTGLYVNCLLEGIDSEAGPNPDLRAEAEARYREGGMEALHALCREKDPELLEKLADPLNPRRVIRGLEIGSGSPRWRRAGQPAGEGAGIICLRPDKDALAAGIRRRAESMFAHGLLEEAAGLRERMTLSVTARQAIGYREAFDVLDGACHTADAVERVVVRTRQLAKRQMTWFRNKLKVTWLDIDTAWTAEAVADKVTDFWNEYGGTAIHC